MVEDQTSLQHTAQSLAKLYWVWRNAGIWSDLCWSIGPVGNHEPHGQPPALGAAATGKWMVAPISTGKWVIGSMPTHTSRPLPSRFQTLGRPTCMGWWRRHSILTTGTATLGVPGRLYWLYWLLLQNNVPAGHLGPACLLPWPRSMSHFQSYFYSFPPAPRLQSGLCTLISLCPSAAGAVASRHQD